MEISYRLAAPMSTRSQLVATALTISSSVSRVTLKMSPCSVWARKKNMDLVLCVAEQTKIMPLSGSSRSFWVGAGRKEEKWISSKPLWQIFKLLCITHNTFYRAVKENHKYHIIMLLLKRAVMRSEVLIVSRVCGREETWKPHHFSWTAMASKTTVWNMALILKHHLWCITTKTLTLLRGIGQRISGWSPKFL